MEDYAKRIEHAQRRVQCGISIELGRGEDAGATPKHLRVGLNSALVFEQAIAGLLIKKGIFTEEEYGEACARAMEQEALRYQSSLRQKLNAPGLTLG